MKKRFFPMIIAMCAVLAFSGAAMAAGNLVNLKTTVPNIPKSLCYQAGSITMEFSAETVLTSGDIIQFTLNNGVVLCKDIDFYVRVSDGATPPGTITSVPVYASDGVDNFTLASTWPDVPANYDYGFTVRGLAGSQIVTLTLVARDIATGVIYTGPDAVTPPNFTLDFDTFTLATDIIAVSLFDEKDSADYLYKKFVATPMPNPAQYIVNSDGYPVGTPTQYFMTSDNAICIDTMTFDYQGEFVVASPDSIPSINPAGIKNTFSGEREIAHILPANEYALVTCKTAPMVGNIILNEGQTASCPPFDFDSGANGSTGYCGNHYDNKIIIQALTNIFPVSDYKVTLEVKVNGLTGDQGVYIFGKELGYLSTETLDANCDGTVTDSVPFETYGGPGTCTDAQSVTPGGEGCTVDCVNKVIRATTAASPLGITQGGNQDFLQLNLPAFRYDSSIVKEGDVVSVRVVVFQDPCGTIFDEDIVIGTFGCTPATSATTLLYPYFTPANGTYFWSAYAITNLSDVEGTVTLYMYESDGDAFKGELATPVAAHTIWTTLLSDSIVNPDITWTQTAGTGTPGDATCYVEAMTTFTADGFGFIAGSPTGESMGYLPRVNGQ